MLEKITNFKEVLELISNRISDRILYSEGVDKTSKLLYTIGTYRLSTHLPRDEQICLGFRGIIKIYCNRDILKNATLYYLLDTFKFRQQRINWLKQQLDIYKILPEDSSTDVTNLISRISPEFVEDAPKAPFSFNFEWSFPLYVFPNLFKKEFNELKLKYLLEDKEFNYDLIQYELLYKSCKNEDIAFLEGWDKYVNK